MIRTRAARARPHRSRHRSERAQGMVEFALVAPPLFFLIFGTIDMGRLVYTYNAIASASREGARLVSLKPQVTSDCDPLQRMESVGKAFPLLQDPNSIYDASSSTVNIDPNASNPPVGRGPTTPGTGQGYVYIYPAIAASTTNCNAPSSPAVTRPHPTAQGGVQNVAVEIQYHFVPWTPVFSSIFSNIIVRTTSVVQADY